MPEMQLQREHWQFCKFVACKNLYYWVNGKSEIKPLHFHDNLQLILLISSYWPLECVFILVGILCQIVERARGNPVSQLLFCHKKILKGFQITAKTNNYRNYVNLKSY